MRVRVALDLLGSLPLPDQLEHLAELEEEVRALTLGYERRRPLEVVDGRRVGVVRLRGFPGPDQVLALLGVVLAQPVVMREQVELCPDGVGFGGLDVAADTLVQHRPGRERHALVRDLLRDHVLEHVGLVFLPFDVHEIERPQGAEVRTDVVHRPELRVDVGQRRRPERAPDDAGHLERAPRRLGQGVDPAEDQAVQALGQLQGTNGRLVLGVDALAADVVEELLDVERVALGARRHQVDERLRRPGACSEELLELGVGEPFGIRLRELRQLDLPELRQLLEAQLDTRAVVEHDEHRQLESGTGEHLQQVTRQRVDPVAVLEHQHERLLARPRLQALREQPLERRLAELGVERPRQSVVRDGEAEERAEQRQALHERRIDGLEDARHAEYLVLLRLLVVDAPQTAPDLLPDVVARVRAERRAGADGDRAIRLAQGVHELGHEPGLAEARLGGDADDHAAPLERVLEGRVECGELPATPDELELLVRPAPRAQAGEPDERVGRDSVRLAAYLQVGKALPGERVTGLLAHGFRHVDPAQAAPWTSAARRGSPRRRGTRTSGASCARRCRCATARW